MKPFATLLILLGILLTLAQPVSTSRAQSGSTCLQPARLTVGSQARVTVWPDLPNRIRNNYTFTATVVGQIPAGAAFQVSGGPACSSGVHWWYVTYNGVSGWTAEGNGSTTYWLEPVGITPACALIPRLTIGGQGRVTPGLPNVIRTAPGTTSSGANSVVMGEIPGGGIFSVLNGPQCGPDGRWWWLVDYLGLRGWTAEGEGTNTYWVEPYGTYQLTCPGFIPSRLTVGGQGRVTLWPSLPNRIRSGPTYQNLVIGHIPAGGIFSVLSGPYCNQNTAWWQVAYGNTVGWTVEGLGATYYLEPR